jgi:hypothetical protein
VEIVLFDIVGSEMTLGDWFAKNKTTIVRQLIDMRNNKYRCLKDLG